MISLSSSVNAPVKPCPDTMTEPPLPSAPLVDLGDGVVLQPPLSRCGRGPGLITFRPSVYGELRDSGTPGPESTEGDDSLDPEPLQKWAEEGYAVVQITLENHLSADASHIVARIKSGVAALESLPECISEGKYGLLGMHSDWCCCGRSR